MRKYIIAIVKRNQAQQKRLKWLMDAEPVKAGLHYEMLNLNYQLARLKWLTVAEWFNVTPQELRGE